MRIWPLAFVLAVTSSALAQPVAPGPPEPPPPSATLMRAIKLYDKTDYLEATIELGKVISKQTQDTPAGISRAEFYYAKALYQLKLYSASLMAFDVIAQRGAEHPYYLPSLKWFVTLARQLPPASGVLHKIVGYPLDVVNDPSLDMLRGELSYLRGVSEYRARAVTALADLAKVPATAEQRPAADLLAGAAALDAGLSERASAVFTAIAASKDKARDLAILTLGRMALAQRKYDAAMAAYAAVPQSSPFALDAAVEGALAAQGKAGKLKAFGGVESLVHAAWNGESTPEPDVLAAVIAGGGCKDDALASLRADAKLLPELAGLVAKSPDDDRDFLQGVRAAKVSPRLAVLLRFALITPAVADPSHFVSALDQELQQVGRSDPTWKSSQVASRVHDDLTVQRSLAVAETGKALRARLKRLQGELGDIVKRTAKAPALHVACPK